MSYQKNKESVAFWRGLFPNTQLSKKAEQNYDRHGLTQICYFYAKLQTAIVENCIILN